METPPELDILSKYNTTISLVSPLFKHNRCNFYTPYLGMGGDSQLLLPRCRRRIQINRAGREPGQLIKDKESKGGTSENETKTNSTYMLYASAYGFKDCMVTP